MLRLCAIPLVIWVTHRPFLPVLDPISYQGNSSPFLPVLDPISYQVTHVPSFPFWTRSLTPQREQSVPDWDGYISPWDGYIHMSLCPHVPQKKYLQQSSIPAKEEESLGNCGLLFLFTAYEHPRQRGGIWKECS